MAIREPNWQHGSAVYSSRNKNNRNFWNCAQKKEIDQNTTTTNILLGRGTIKRKFVFLHLSETK